MESGRTEGRRYDIDWIRVIAIFLLVVYHVAIGFQPWGMMIGFITSDDSWPSLWTPMSMLNVWRIPLLFFVSGMGIRFAMRRRSWKQLLAERARRILVPFLFGMVAIVPIHVYIWQRYNHFETSYAPGPGHLWFLGNLFCYVLVLLPVFCWLKSQSGEHGTGRWLSRLWSGPWGLSIVFALFIAEALIVRPVPFELYAMTWHGFFLGLLAFFFGFLFAWVGEPFRIRLIRWRWLFLTAALVLFLSRLFLFAPVASGYLISIESNCWVLSVFAFGCKYLNRPGAALRYFSQAAYPVYIVHMVFLYLGSLIIFPLEITAPLQFLLLLLFTFSGSIVSYDLVRRVPFVRVLFGLRPG